MEETIRILIKYLEHFLSGISILILVIGVLRALVGFIKNEVAKENDKLRAKNINVIKNILGSYVLLSLEVLIAADIIQTIMDPSLNDVLILGGIVVIRTVISYFLGKEIEHTPID